VKRTKEYRKGVEGWVKYRRHKENYLGAMVVYHVGEASIEIVVEISREAVASIAYEISKDASYRFAEASDSPNDDGI